LMLRRNGGAGWGGEDPPGELDRGRPARRPRESGVVLAASRSLAVAGPRYGRAADARRGLSSARCGLRRGRVSQGVQWRLPRRMPCPGGGRVTRVGAVGARSVRGARPAAPTGPARRHRGDPGRFVVPGERLPSGPARSHRGDPGRFVVSGERLPPGPGRCHRGDRTTAGETSAAPGPPGIRPNAAPPMPKPPPARTTPSLPDLPGVGPGARRPGRVSAHPRGESCRRVATRPGCMPSLSRSTTRRTTPPVRRERPATVPPSAARDVPAATGPRASTAGTRGDRRQTGRRPRRATEPSGLTPGRDLDHRAAVSPRCVPARSPLVGAVSRSPAPTHRQIASADRSASPPPPSPAPMGVHGVPAVAVHPHVRPATQTSGREVTNTGPVTGRASRGEIPFGSGSPTSATVGRPGRSASPWPVAARLAGSPVPAPSDPAARPTIDPSCDPGTPLKFHVARGIVPLELPRHGPTPLPPFAGAAPTKSSTTAFLTAAPHGRPRRSLMHRQHASRIHECDSPTAEFDRTWHDP
jgi:hypothetical protein